MGELMWFLTILPSLARQGSDWVHRLDMILSRIAVNTSDQVVSWQRLKRAVTTWLVHNSSANLFKIMSVNEQMDKKLDFWVPCTAQDVCHSLDIDQLVDIITQVLVSFSVQVLG